LPERCSVKVNVRLFAGLHDLIGQRQVSVELSEGATVSDLREHLSSQYPAVTPFLPTLVFAVGEEYVAHEHALRDGDEVALIPPVSGGAAADRFAVTKGPLDPQALVDSVRKDESGAVALFCGVVRNNNRGRRVLHLEYEAYPSMAEKKMREIADEIRSRWQISDVAIQHRVGRMEVGETSLLVAVSAPHRREAFEACHHAVDRIKQIVPVWKKEVFEGGEVWVEGNVAPTPETVGPGG
jgi:molybdopterin converting factor subunit 1